MKSVASKIEKCELSAKVREVATMGDDTPMSPSLVAWFFDGVAADAGTAEEMVAWLRAVADDRDGVSESATPIAKRLRRVARRGDLGEMRATAATLLARTARIESMMAAGASIYEVRVTLVREGLAFSEAA